MKITKIQTWLVRPRWAFIEISTDAGISGWGEPVLEGRAATVCECIHEMEPYLIGADPMKIEDLWTVLFRGGFYRGGGILMSAISGIDQALWDIKGKYFNVPVWQLMGGSCRDKMRVSLQEVQVKTKPIKRLLAITNNFFIFPLFLLIIVLVYFLTNQPI